MLTYKNQRIQLTSSFIYCIICIRNTKGERMKNKTKYLITDLDRTMIFSKRFYDDKLDMVPVEHKDGNIIAYMTQKALSVVKENISNIIPVTTRSLSEFQRVEPFQNVEWAVVGNGSLILHKGKPLKEWSERIQKLTTPIDNEYAYLIDWVNKTFEDELEQKATKVESFVFAKVKEECLISVYRKVDSLIIPNWQFTIQNKKMYIMPKVVSKESAAKFVISKLKNRGELFFAGDGILDVEMLNLSSKYENAESYTPAESDAHDLSTTKNLTVVPPSARGGEIILRIVFEKGETK